MTLIGADSKILRIRIPAMVSDVSLFAQFRYNIKESASISISLKF